MRSLRRRAALAALAATGAAMLAAPLSAHAAGPIVKFKVAGSSKLLTHQPVVGFASLQAQFSVPINQQRWEMVDGPGPAVYLRNIDNQQCLRANPVNDTIVRTRTCNLSDDSASREQQWILSSTGQLANRDRLIRGVAANSLTADFQSLSHNVKLAPFTGAANQKWSTIAG